MFKNRISEQQRNLTRRFLLTVPQVHGWRSINNLNSHLSAFVYFYFPFLQPYPPTQTKPTFLCTHTFVFIPSHQSHVRVTSVHYIDWRLKTADWRLKIDPHYYLLHLFSNPQFSILNSQLTLCVRAWIIYMIFFWRCHCHCHPSKAHQPRFVKLSSGICSLNSCLETQAHYPNHVVRTSTLHFALCTLQHATPPTPFSCTSISSFFPSTTRPHRVLSSKSFCLY